MGYLDNSTIVVDAVLTKEGRRLLAEGQGLDIQYFTLSDTGIDYTLWNPDHPSGSAYYGEAIENLPSLEALPNSAYFMRNNLLSLSREVKSMPYVTLDGFGIAASATILDAELEDGTAIPGQSDNTYSITAYYEMNGFEFRVAATDRSEFLTYQRGGSNKIEAATRDAVTQVDAQISYDFADSGMEYLAGLRVSLQGVNLTDEKEETIDGNGIVTLRREFGPSYMLNLNYAFY